MIHLHMLKGPVRVKNQQTGLRMWDGNKGKQKSKDEQVTEGGDRCQDDFVRSIERT